MERNSFRRVSGESPETLRKLFLSTKFPHQEIRWNFCVLRSGKKNSKRTFFLKPARYWTLLNVRYWILNTLLKALNPESPLDLHQTWHDYSWSQGKTLPPARSEKRRHRRRSGVFIVNFEQVNADSNASEQWYSAFSCLTLFFTFCGKLLLRRLSIIIIAFQNHRLWNFKLTVF